MAKTFIAILLAIICPAAMAGGTSVPVQMLDLTQTAPDVYLLTYKTLDGPEYEFESLPRNTVLRVHLRFARIRYMASGGSLTLEKYRSAIDMLRSQVGSKKAVRFGQMGGGMCPIEGKPNEFESDALDVYDEGPPENNKKERVVYSFCKYR